MAENKTHICPIPFLSMTLSPKGDAYPCCFLYGDQGVDYGNIIEQGTIETWNGEKIKSLRREFLSGDIRTCKKYIEFIPGRGEMRSE